MKFYSILSASFFFLLIPFLTIGQESETNASLQIVVNELLFEEARKIRVQNPDSSIQFLELCYAKFMDIRDTSNAITVLTEIAETYGHQANYKKSYDGLWKALLLADEANKDDAKADIYISIGRYYSFYKRAEEALKYFQLSLNINKQLVESQQLEKVELVKNYYAICATYRELGNPELGQNYLDSCFSVHQPKISPIAYQRLQFEEAFLKINSGEYPEAIAIYEEILPWFEATNPSYRVLVYSYMGDAYLGLKNYNKSEFCYKKALEISRIYKSHIDFTPIVYQKLSDLYYLEGDHQRAYHSLKKVKELDAKFFDSRSPNNRPLLEIQDAFRKEKERQTEFMQQKRLDQLEHTDKVLLLQKTILIITIGFIVLIGIIYFNYVKAKHRSEKQLIQKKQELEIQKANELLELKNKELAASALQLIEKDEFLSSLKDRLKGSNGKMSTHELKQVLRSISVSNAQNWEEFKTRFVAVNEGFYKRLSEKFPSLSQGDLKLCALIKLNFSSKEMAKLLGISIESVHTTRYRLRKKLNLTRSINLTEFIASL